MNTKSHLINIHIKNAIYVYVDIINLNLIILTYKINKIIVLIYLS